MQQAFDAAARGQRGEAADGIRFFIEDARAYLASTQARTETMTRQTLFQQMRGA